MKQITTKVIILKRINYGEADRILTVLTPEFGKISLLAKAVRRSKSKLAGGLELFSESEITYIDGKGELKTAISTRLKKHYKRIPEDVHRTMVAYDFIKYISEFTEHDIDDGWYKLLSTGLAGLDEEAIADDVVFVWFFTKLYRLHGSGLNLEKPLNSATFNSDKVYDFSYDDMSFIEKESGTITPNHIKFLRLVAKSTDPKSLSRVEQANQLSEKLKEILQTVNKLHKP